MFPVATMQGALAQALPDTCKVPAAPAPPVPVPFPNVGNGAQAVLVTTTVKVMNMPCVVKNSQIPMSQADNGGVALGVSSGTVMGPVVFKNGSTKLKLQGKPAVLMGGMTGHNGPSASNAPAGQIVTCMQVKLFCAG